MPQPRLPDFLIIGAMKSGTTTLFHDLLTHPQVYMPPEKEPNNLQADDVLTPAGEARYRELFREARADQLCAEASTAYTKRPALMGVPERAMQVLGPNVKLIYIVREPVSRALSQYSHQFCDGRVPEDIDLAFQLRPHMLHLSQYARQLEPWIEMFGRDAIKVVCFEHYMSDRPAGVSDVLQFVGLDPSLHQVEPERRWHESKVKPVIYGRWKRFTRTPVYRRLVRPLVSRRVRRKFKLRLLPRLEQVKPEPSMETIDYIIDQIRADHERFAALLGLEAPWWDLDEVRARYQKRLSPSTDPQPTAAPPATASAG